MITISTPDSVWNQSCSDCKQECMTIDYRVTLSSVSAPNIEWQLTTKNFIEASNVVGQTGLWIGISFVSVMEVVEMLYRLLRHECHVLKRRLMN